MTRLVTSWRRWVASIASSASRPCQSVRAHASRGGKAAGTATSLAHGAILSAPSRNHSRRYWRTVSRLLPLICRVVITRASQALRALSTPYTHSASPCRCAARQSGKTLLSVARIGEHAAGRRTGTLHRGGEHTHDARVPGVFLPCRRCTYPYELPPWGRDTRPWRDVRGR